MKTNQPQKLLSLASLFVALCSAALAGSITNNFDVSADYVANGIVGETFWDGVYLGFGDIRNGDPGGSGNGTTSEAHANSFPSVLSITETRGDWSAPGDDGFFLWKLVSGDFDVSVESLPVWNTVANNFAGLLVRAYNPDNSGAPYSTNAPAAGALGPGESWVSLLRGQEFNINETRLATNGGNIELTFTDNGPNRTNETRFFRIVRTGNDFSFYWKTNYGDAWVQRTNGTFYPNGFYTRNDLAGVPMQIGICQALFSANSAQVYFTDFELTGPNVTNPPSVVPPAPSNVTISSPNTSGSVGISWQTNGGNGSLVVIRQNGLLIGNPVQGQVYTGDLNFTNPATFLSADRSHIVYSGAGTNITVTGLGGSNQTYNVYVFSYATASPPVYNTASPATNSFAGPGIVSSVSFTVSPTNLPVSGAGLANIRATYTSGDSYDVSSDPNSTVTSSDPSVINVANGVMNALALSNNPVSISVSYAGFSASQNVATHTPAFTDNFGTTHDYIANGLAGATWDGLFLNYGDVPLTTATDNRRGNDNAAGSCSQFIASTNVLFCDAAGSTWAVAGNDGPFLYKVVTGDFQASVHVGPMSIINNCDGGIMARLFNNTGTASQGGGGGAAGQETHVNWVKIQNGQVALRATVNSGGTTVVNGLNTTDRTLLMQRVNSTNFLFYEKATTGDTWNAVPLATFVLPAASNSAPMEVGILQEMRTASDGFVPFDTLMIDGPGITPPATPPLPATNFTGVLNGDLSMTFNWVATDALGNPVRSMLVMRAGGPVTAAPTLALAGNIGGTGTPVNFGTGVNLSDGNWMVFATGNPNPTTNVTCTVKNLSPGVVYYAEVYTFVGSGGNKSFNIVSTAVTNIQDGVLLGITLVKPPPIPLGGLAELQVIGNFSGGGTANISKFATITPANAALMAATNGALSGFVLGSTTITAAYSGFSTSAVATVVSPTFTDLFTVTQDYVANRQTNSPWDGVYLNYHDVPESTYTAVNQGLTAYAMANDTVTIFTNITTANPPVTNIFGGTNCLSVTNVFGGWENGNDDGFFLFKYVPADFQMAVHIRYYDSTEFGGPAVAFVFPGIGARAYSYGTNGTDIGSPAALNFNPGVNGENWVNFTRFDNFGIGTYPRLNITNVVLQSIQLNPNNGDNWLLMIRSQGTNFNFYERATNTAPWRLTPLQTSYSQPEFAGQPMQVGIQWMGFGGGTPALAQFDNFMLNSSLPTLTATSSGGNVLVSWPSVPGVVLQETFSVSAPVTWTTISPPLAATLVNGGIATLSLPETNAAAFFRLAK